ncbi:MAG: collagen triple helix repeat protein [Caudoviricetes sp.]|nr:MAG: collagen triple helix repeat protein [Caudoviricetes sp.]
MNLDIFLIISDKVIYYLFNRRIYMDFLTYALCQGIATSAVSGVKDLKVEGTDLIITTNDGNQMVMNFPKPKDGVDGKDGADGKNGIDGVDGKDGSDGKNGEDGISVVSASINEENHLIFSMSNGAEIDAGELDFSSGLNFATAEDINSLFK